MESILDNIAKEEVWNEYLSFKENQASVSKQEIDDIRNFITQKKYIDIANKISSGNYTCKDRGLLLWRKKCRTDRIWKGGKWKQALYLRPDNT